ncbi:MAG: hypothetical protein AAFZ63_20705 [Bacteroidota bacterium]
MGYPSCWIVNERVAQRLIDENVSGIVVVPLAQGEDFTQEGVTMKAHKLDL